MRPLDCKWCAYFGPEGSTWETRSALLLNKEILDCRLRSQPIPTPPYTYCANYVSEDEKEKLLGNELPVGPIWIRTHDEMLPRVPYPYGSEYNEEDYRLTPIPDWSAYLEIREPGREEVIRAFLLDQIDKYRNDNLLSGTTVNPDRPEIEAACSGCYQSFPESKIHVIPIFSRNQEGYITAYHCDNCWITALEQTRQRIQSTASAEEIASAAAFFEGHSHYIHEFKRGVSLEKVRQVLLYLIDGLKSGKVELRVR